jgi:hypothetical protein
MRGTDSSEAKSLRISKPPDEWAAFAFSALLMRFEMERRSISEQKES